jgi:hypothetical protein
LDRSPNCRDDPPWDVRGPSPAVDEEIKFFDRPKLSNVLGEVTNGIVADLGGRVGAVASHVNQDLAVSVLPDLVDDVEAFFASRHVISAAAQRGSPVMKSQLWNYVKGISHQARYKVDHAFGDCSPRVCGYLGLQ